MERLYIDLEALHIDDSPRAFVVQTHWRGKGVHWDFRYESKPDSEVLYGFTIAAMKPGIAKREVVTVEQAKGFFDWKNWKLTNTPSVRRVFTEEKKPHSREWLALEGVVEPGEVGALPGETGVFAIFDKGKLYLGAQKPYFREFFLTGKRLTGRWIFRLIQREKPLRAKALFIWQCAKPIDALPYVISKRAVEDEWMPPTGASALPPEIKEQIPKELRYWLEKDRKKAKEKRDRLVQAMKEETVKIKLEKPLRYAYVWHFFKKRRIIRAGPTAETFKVYIEERKDKPLLCFVLYKDILEQESVPGLWKEEKNHKWLTYDGYIAPGEEGNPTPDTPSYHLIQTKGRVILLEKTPSIVRMKFLSGRLKGLYMVERETPTAAFMTFTKSTPPAPRQ